MDAELLTVRFSTNINLLYVFAIIIISNNSNIFFRVFLEIWKQARNIFNLF
jgi:hypothetical protein